MSFSTFPRFRELPQELQMQVWKYAAAEVELWDSVIPLPDSSKMHLEHFCTSTAFKRLYVNTVEYMRFEGDTGTRAAIEKKYKSIAQTRTALMQCCRLSRLIMLEIWKKEVEAIRVWRRATRRSITTYVDGAKVTREVEEAKVETVKMLAGLIANMKGQPLTKNEKRSSSRK